MRHRLVSQLTSFVAVDESRVVGDGRPLRVLQPVELPEGVSYEGIFGEPVRGVPMRIGVWGLTLQETANGTLRVAEVDADGAAARRGARAGATVRSVNRAAVTEVSQLERVLLQAGSGLVRLELAPGGELKLPTP